MFLLSIIIVDFIIQFKFAVTYSIFKPITPLLMGYQPLFVSFSNMAAMLDSYFYI